MYHSDQTVAYRVSYNILETFEILDSEELLVKLSLL